MNMKLSYRDKVIFIVAIIIIILVAGFFLLIKPKFEEIDRARAAYDAKVVERQNVDAKIDTYGDIMKSVKDAARAIGEEQDVFLPEQDPYLNEMYIREALESERLDIISMNTSYTSASAINRYAVKPAHILAYENKIKTDLYNELPQEVYDVYNGVPDPTYPNSIIGTTTMTFTYRSEDIRTDYGVMDKLAADEKTIVLNTISSKEQATDSNEPRETTCTITMYSIFPLNVEQVLLEPDEVDMSALNAPAE